MQRFILRRTIAVVLTLLVVSVVIFVLARLQGDPRISYLGQGGDMDKTTWDKMGKEMGLDRPIYVQWLIFAGRLLQGNLGKSILQRRPVATLIIQRVPTTGKIALGAFIFAVGVGIPLGVLAAVKRGTVWDYLGRTFAILGQSFPVFVVGLVFILIFGVKLRWLPTSRDHGWTSYILPSISMGWLVSAGLLRLVRSSLLEILDSQFIMFARAKGVSRAMVIWKHGIRNALIAPLTYAGLILAWMVTGSIIIETVFAMPGLGWLAIQSTSSSDYPLLQGIVLLVAIGYLGMSLLIDVAYAYIDPRIRYQ